LDRPAPEGKGLDETTVLIEAEFLVPNVPGISDRENGHALDTSFLDQFSIHELVWLEELSGRTEHRA
jgi:hypothetical protein